MKNKLIIFLIFVLSSCSTLKFAKENRYNSYNLKLNSVDISIDKSSFTITPTIYGNHNEFSVISVQGFLNIEAARLIVFPDSAFLLDRLNHKIYSARIPSNSLNELENVLLSKNESRTTKIILSSSQELFISSVYNPQGNLITIKFNNYSFKTEVIEFNSSNKKLSKPELPKNYEKVPFTLR